jgi:hypothetical protein
MNTYIGIDLGTSAVKLLLVAADGRILKSATEEYPLSFPRPGWSEQNPEDWLRATREGMEALLEGEDREAVRGVSFGGQMHGLVALDKEDRVIRPAILWNDGRTGKETEYLNEKIGKKRLSEYTANIAFAGFTAPKLLWMKENEPKNFARIAKIMLPKVYLAYRMTGVFSTDYSDAGGTLLLDEIGELPLSLQSKLLRVLQEGEFKRIGGTEIISVDVRILCSTNRNLKNMVSAGEFRPDLYYRINVMEIIVPPLRERIEDISDLANHFIKESNRRNGTVISGMHAGAYQALATYHWPGNVRELEHSIERACILCGAGFLEEHHFSFLRGMQPHNEDLAKPVPRYSLSAKWEDAEAKRILQVLEACGGNRQKAASILQISRTTLFRKMKKYGLQ